MRLFVILILFLSSCSNKYTVDKDILNEISCINYESDLDSIEKYEFTRVFKKLISDSSCLEKKYDLQVSFSQISENRIILKDAESIRDNINLLVKFKLSQKDKILYESEFREITSYNTMFSPYSSSVEKDESINDIYINAAEELRRRLIIFFNRKSVRDESAN